MQSGKRNATAPRGTEARDAIVAWFARADTSLALIPLLGATVGAFAYFVGALLLYDPAVWPDEALFANPAVNLLRHGHLGTDLMGGYLPGIETHTYWMPPFYYLALAPVFALFGVSAPVMRLFSAFTAASVLALTYAIGRRAGLGRVAACIAVAVLAVDAVFLRAARLGRMDMLAIALMLGALYFALASRAAKRAPIFAGVLAGLATMTHPLGMIAPLAIGLHYLVLADASRWRRLLCFALGVLGPALLWGIYILGDTAAFSAQIGAQVGRKAAYEEGLHARWSRSGESADYGRFCDRVNALIPAGSRVLVSVFPDVYLCLSHRADLTFRSFVPEQLPVAEETQRRVIDESDIIITGRWSPGSLADTIARREGELVGEVGVHRGYTYHALVYRMRKATAP